jgi:ubiquinone/menaquinone biosynthesis C-methylase UbiE
VEFGAGTGRLTCLLAPLVSFIHAFDRSQAMLDVAAARLEALGLRNWSTAACEHRQVPVADASADLAISGWSVCYTVVENPDSWRETALPAVLAEMERVIRPGGMLILIETLGTGCEQPTPPEHLVEYYAWLEAHGFRRDWIRTDYRFESQAEAGDLTSFFFGKEMLAKIIPAPEGALLPECTGIWWKRSLL